MTETEEVTVNKIKPSSDEIDPECVRVTDFSTEVEQRAWQTVNDNVMGGRSLGGPEFADGLMVFAGETNTDGGGFSSLRLALEPGVLVPLRAGRVSCPVRRPELHGHLRRQRELTGSTGFSSCADRVRRLGPVADGFGGVRRLVSSYLSVAPWMTSPSTRPSPPVWAS